jgi:Uma2 family endonuclease
MTPATLVSVEEYLRTGYPDGDREYVDGEVLERNIGELDHSDTQGRILVYLRNHYAQFWSGVAARLQVSATRFRVPDIMFFAGPMPSGRIATTPPHIIVEVLSPEDRAVLRAKNPDIEVPIEQVFE